MDVGKWTDNVEVNRHQQKHQDGDQQDAKDAGFDIIDVAPPGDLRDDGLFGEIDATLRTPFEPEPDPEPSPESLLLLEKIREGDHKAVRQLLEDGAIMINNQEGKSVLHLAVAGRDIEMIKLLFEKGVDPEAADHDGTKPLFLAVTSGDTQVIELLLNFGANVESKNEILGHTAFYKAVEDKSVAVAKILLDHHADIDAPSSDGQTALFSAVEAGQLELVRLLLKRGANKKLILENGRTIEDFAEGDNDMIQVLELLRETQLLRGPSVKNSKTKTQELRFTYSVASPPADNINKRHACRDFEATIIDFFVDERERRIQVSSSMYEILYGKGPNVIMAQARGRKMPGQNALFRWYHIPSNNMEWVQVLANRISGDDEPGAMALDEESRSRLAFANNTSRQYRATTTHSSFMRPLAQSFKSHLNSSAAVEGNKNHVMLFTPYLHFETCRGYLRMNQTIVDLENRDRARRLQGSRPLPKTGRPIEKVPPGPPPGRHFKKKIIPTLGFLGSGPDANDSTVSSEREVQTGFLTTLLKSGRKFQARILDLKTNVWTNAKKVVKPTGADTNSVDDLEKGVAVDDARSNKSKKTQANLSHVAGVDSTLPISQETPTNKAMEGDAILPVAKAGEETLLKTTPVPENAASADPTSPNSPPIPNKEDLVSNPGLKEETSKPKEQTPLQNSTVAEVKPPQKQPRSNREPKERRIPAGSPDYNLINGYLWPTNPGDIPPLQIRRTLDQYYYTHTETSAERNVDQVVSRYLKSQSQETKIFMVDQLWLWILNEDTVISCCPQRWDLLREEEYRTKLTTYRALTIRKALFDTRSTWGHVDLMEEAWTQDEIISQIDDLNTQMIFVEEKKRELAPNQQASVDRIIAYEVRTKPDYDFESSLVQLDSRFRILENGLRATSVIVLYFKRSPKAHLNPSQLLHALQRQASEDVTEEYIPPPVQFARRRPGAPPPPPGASLPSYMLPFINFMENPNKQKNPNQPNTTKPTYPGKDKSKQEPEPTGGKPSFDSNDDASEESSKKLLVDEQTKKRRAFLQVDPLNVHNSIMKHLQGTSRAPITSARQLASIITDRCVNVFDEYEVSEEYQFFEFFERSIGSVVFQEALCFQQFSESIANTRRSHQRAIDSEAAIFNINKETELLVEIKDIREELGFLNMVLSDQLKTVAEFARILDQGKVNEAATTRETVSSSIKIDRVKRHLDRVQDMEKLVQKTYKSLNHLLDLKQKQANVSEALSARKQAEITTQQAEKAAEYAEKGVDEATLARTQAEETARQGRTVLLFTVITIIFLPLAFVASFFAINIEAFPVNANGKLPLNYVLQYLFGISSAVSLPFILVAFNQDRIGNYLKEIGDYLKDKLDDTNFTKKGGWLALLSLLAIFLSVIWTRNLDSGIKAAITITLVLLAFIAAVWQILNIVVGTARRGASTTSSGSSSERSLVDD